MMTKDSNKHSDDADRDYKIYQMAKTYWPSLEIPNVTAEVIETYLKPDIKKPESKSEVYKRLLHSAQNANMKPKVIGQAIGGFDRLGEVLHKFEPAEVLKFYGEDGHAILDAIKQHFTIMPRDTQRSIWPRYCQTIISAANFVEQFETIDAFTAWADFFDKDDKARAALPMLIQHEIEGLGFALSCDFLKEIGYVNFPKPDVHLRDIFIALEMCEADADDYHLLKAIVRVARNAGVTPYNADKVFWLIGSGNFYKHKGIIGNEGKIEGRKEAFIQYVEQNL